MIFNLAEMQIGDRATWAGAVGTLLAFLAVTVQILIQWVVRMKSEKRSQAQHISAWIDYETLSPSLIDGIAPVITVVVANKSSEPVYRVVVSLVPFDEKGSGEETKSEYRDFISVLPPKEEVYIELEGSYKGTFFQPSVELVFVDRNNINWVRKGNGKLISTRKEPTEFYNISKPLSWRLPESKRPK